MPPIIAGAVIAGVAGLGSAAISSAGARGAASTQAKSQQQAISAQERAALEAQSRRDEAVRLKQAAAKNIKFPTFLEIPEAQEFSQTLRDRIAGRGLIDVEAQTSPIAEQVRAGLGQTRAAIGSAASARGLGRSTIPVSQEKEASQAAERDIASRMQQLELARQEQIGQAVTQFGRVSELEAASQQNKAKFQQGAEFNIADTISRDAEATKNDQFAIASTISSNGANAASWQLLNSQILAAGLLTAGKSYQQAISQSSDSIISAIKNEQTNRTGAVVNVGDSQLLKSSSSFLNSNIGANLGRG